MELVITGSNNKVSVSDAVFGRDFSEDLVHQVVVAYRNAGRAGTKAQKTRSEVAGTTKKSKKQKSRARDSSAESSDESYSQEEQQQEEEEDDEEDEDYDEEVCMCARMCLDVCV